MRAEPFDKLRTAPFDKLRAELARPQLTYGAGKHGVKLRVANRHRAEEEAPILPIAYHDEDRVITSEWNIKLVDGDLTLDQPSAMAVDAQAFAADIAASWQVWTVHGASDDATHQSLDGAPGIGAEAVLGAQLTDCQLGNPGGIPAHAERLLDYVVGEAEASLERGRIEGGLLRERQVSAVHAPVIWMVPAEIGITLRAARWYRR